MSEETPQPPAPPEPAEPHGLLQNDSVWLALFGLAVIGLLWYARHYHLSIQQAQDEILAAAGGVGLVYLAFRNVRQRGTQLRLWARRK